MQTALDEQTFEMHREAIEGGVFYRNDLAKPAFVKSYFPVSEYESNYNSAPHIAFPITSQIVNRLASLIHSGVEIEVSSAQVQERFDEIMIRLDGAELARDLLVKSLTQGNHLVTLHADYHGRVMLKQWGGEWCWRTSVMGIEAVGYCWFTNKKGERVPLTSKINEKEMADVTVVSIDEVFWDGTPHGLPFAPAVWFRGVDRGDENRYGKAYHLRYRDLNIEYNQVYSQASKAVKILQNVWVTDRELDNPNQRLRINPDTINFVGAGGKLEQAVRQLSIEPELEMLDRLKAQISASAQVPDFMTGLKDVGKVESGLALQIVSGPLMELVNRIKSEFKPRIKELFTKMLAADYAFAGQWPPAFELEVEFADNVLPVDQMSEVGMLTQLVDRQILSVAEARLAAAKVMGMELDEPVEVAS